MLFNAAVIDCNISKFYEISLILQSVQMLIRCLYLGAGVVTTRAHVHYIVTEHGVADLFGKNLRQRAHALIKISHPAHREWLEKEAFQRLKCMPSP
jgi:acyl-CoA hydrolase